MLPMAFLLASRMIYEEASWVLFSKNTFVLPPWQFMAKFFAAFNGKTQLACITQLELAFTSSDLHNCLPKLARTPHPDDLLNAIVDTWSQKASLVLSSTMCEKITIRVDETQSLHKSYRFVENEHWLLVIPGDSHDQAVLPRKVQMKGLPDPVNLQRVLKSIGGHREEDPSADW